MNVVVVLMKQVLKIWGGFDFQDELNIWRNAEDEFICEFYKCIDEETVNLDNDVNSICSAFANKFDAVQNWEFWCHLTNHSDEIVEDSLKALCNLSSIFSCFEAY